MAFFSGKMFACHVKMPGKHVRMIERHLGIFSGKMSERHVKMSRRHVKIVGRHFFSGKVFGETSGFKLSAISWRNSLKCFCRPTVANFSKDNLQTILRCPRHLV